MNLLWFVCAHVCLCGVCVCVWSVVVVGWWVYWCRCVHSHVSPLSI